MVHCPSCGHENLEFMFSDYEELTNTIIRKYECPSCGKEYTTYEMIKDEQEAAYKEIQFWKDNDKINRTVIYNLRRELRGVITKLERAKRMLDGIVVEDIE